MTKKEGIKLLFNRVDNEIQKSGWWIFNKRNIELVITRILEPYEKKANLPLPEKLSIYDMTIDKQGILHHKELRKWSEICVTGIKTEKEYDGRHEVYIYTRHLLICMNNGDVFQYTLGDISKFKGLLGHFIEQYKIDFLNQIN